MLCLSVSMWTGAWFHLGNVGTEPLELSSITHLCCASNGIAKAFWSQRPQSVDEVPEILFSACTCGLRRVLGEGHYIITGDGAQPRSTSRLLYKIMWGWVSFRVCKPKIQHATLSDNHLYHGGCWRDAGCICRLMTLLWHLQQDLTLREYDCMVLVSRDGYLICHSILFGSISVRFHRYELNWLSICVSHSYKRSSINDVMPTGLEPNVGFWEYNMNISSVTSTCIFQ